MEWKKVHVTLPREIADIYDGIAKIQKNSCIAGGFLCDLYMKTPYNDVDIFIKNHPEKEQKIHDFLQRNGYKKIKNEGNIESEYELAMSVTTYKKGKWDLQLIASKLGIKQVKYFDYRFREFFYFNHQCYASKEALRDIQNKELVLGFPGYTLKSFYRLFQFKHKYGFKIDHRSLDRFTYLFNHGQYHKADIQRFFDKRPSSFAKEIQRRLDAFFKDERYNLPTKGTLKDLPKGIVEKILQYPTQRDLFELAFVPKEKKVLKTLPLTVHGENMLTLYRKNALESLAAEWKKQRMRLIALGESELYENILQTIASYENENVNPTEYIAQYMTHTFLQPYAKKLYKIAHFDKVFSDYAKKEIEPLISIHTNYTFFNPRKNNDFKDYAKGNLVLIDIPVFGSVCYNLRTNKIQYNPTHFDYETVENFINDYIIKKSSLI